MRKSSLLVHALVAGAVLLGGAALSNVAHAADDPIKTRREGFDANKKSMGAIKKILDDNAPLAGITVHAQDLNTFAKQVPELFPEGSDKGDTKAKAEIWKNLTDFNAKAQSYVTETAKLADIAASGDKPTVARQFGAVAATCKACHDNYRAE